MKFLLIAFSILFSIKINFSDAQKLTKDLRLQKILEKKVQNFNGQVGIYVENLKTGKFVAINADSIFPTASMVKVPIMIGVFDEILKGKLKYESEIMFRDSIKYDDGITGSLKDSSNVPLAEAIWLMETISDNTASLWLQSMTGGLRINSIMDSLGFNNIKVNSRTKGRETNRSLFGWGQTSPRHMAGLMKALRKGEVFTKDASNRMYRTLGNQFWDGEGLSQIPESVKFASKTGAVNKSRSEVTFVHAPSGEYVYCIVTKNQKDESWVRSNEGYEIIRNVAATLWQYFEPKSTYKPVAGYENW
jgi:beta-lactamase class A